MRTALTLGLLLLTLGCQPNGEPAPATKKPSTLLTATPATFELGTVQPKSKHERPVKLTNAGATPVEIKSLQSSCPCAKLALPKRRVEPGETITATLTVDLTEEPDYRGTMGLWVEGRTAEGRLAVKVEAEVTVRSAVP